MVIYDVDNKIFLISKGSSESHLLHHEEGQSCYDNYMNIKHFFVPIFGQPIYFENNTPFSCVMS